MTPDERIEALRVNIESLHSNVAQLYEVAGRHDGQIAKLTELLAQDAENIRALARIAEAH
jgi:hypothetical protein